MSPKWSTLCLVQRKTLTQSISQSPVLKKSTFDKKNPLTNYHPVLTFVTQPVEKHWDSAAVYTVKGII